MNLEDAIKQKVPFNSARERAAVNLIFTHNWLVAKTKELFKPYDITSQQFNVLRILRGQYPEPITTSEIRCRMLDRMSDVSRIVDRLVKKEFVDRHICQSDKRLVDVVINSKGLALLEEMDNVNLEIQTLMDNLTEEEAQTLNELLDKARSNQKLGC
ncbi:MarR family transcriptional regulator [Pontibacter sp. G13]|uniref:MarR family winged helix-turn-helix transcriptional regulator n=1 Tax=Pontibacter sp. G13 TaxID=3074898 RepID=UPI00288B10BF|nr:MarR family transcriptional regulator [Pontibacter sp. G13]WNJ20725.1 MarR family transcriptional regulator [Pontibacter sp. G13]